MQRATSLTLTWRRQQWGAVPADRWYVYGPPPTDACGGVWRERGLWRAEVWPRGRHVLGAYYVRRDKAMQHIERWLRAHPGWWARRWIRAGSRAAYHRGRTIFSRSLCARTRWQVSGFPDRCV